MGESVKQVEANDAEFRLIPFDSIRGVHPHVASEYIDSFPIQQENTELTLLAMQMLIRQTALAVVEEKPDEFWLIGGFNIWAALSAWQQKHGQKKLENVSIAAWIYRDNLDVLQIKEIAAVDLWLRITSNLPQPALLPAVLKRVHDSIGAKLSKAVMPFLNSDRKIAKFLGFKSHASLSKLSRKKENSPITEAEDNSEDV